MIQVCSRCSTRWNVRDRQRSWCPRCHGTLLAPSVTASAPPAGSDPRWAPQHTALSGTGATQAPPRLPAGFRWIAVRPGSGPPPRRRKVTLGPTPRYASIPRWGLQEYFEPVDGPTVATHVDGPSPRFVRITLMSTMIIFGLAALAHVVRYGLLLVNRSTLLNPILAFAATWGTVVVSVLALFAMYFMLCALAYWLIARRAAAFARIEQPETRAKWEIYCGCLIPVVNLFFAPVFVTELARIERRYRELRGPIVAWWCAWVASTLVSAFAAITALPFITRDVQGAADNTLLTAVAYLLALAAVLLVRRVFQGFESTPVEKAVKRWLVAESAVPVEPERRDPAA